MADYGGYIGATGKLEVNTGSLTDVGLVRDVTFNVTVGEVDISHQQTDATPPYVKRWLPGLIRVEVTFAMLFDPGSTEHKATILDLLGAEKAFKYTWPDGSTWEFNGFYTGPSVEIPNEDALNGDCTIRVAGDMTFTGA